MKVGTVAARRVEVEPSVTLPKGVPLLRACGAGALHRTPRRPRLRHERLARRRPRWLRRGSCCPRLCRRQSCKRAWKCVRQMGDQGRTFPIERNNELESESMAAWAEETFHRRLLTRIRAGMMAGVPREQIWCFRMYFLSLLLKSYWQLLR